VGAGIAGLTAGLRLRQAGLAVVVLEAADRVGGRLYADVLADGTPIDRGGAWLGPGQDRAYALAAELGVGTYPTWGRGEGKAASATDPAAADGSSTGAIHDALARGAIGERGRGRVPDGQAIDQVREVLGLTDEGRQITTVAEPGAFFGEMSVLLARPHTATVRALEPSTFHVVDGRDRSDDAGHHRAPPS
jgi:hypothetical protein